MKSNSKMLSASILLTIGLAFFSLSQTFTPPAQAAPAPLLIAQATPSGLSQVFDTLKKNNAFATGPVNGKNYSWVQFNANGSSDIRTEGMGYAMVLAVSTGDRTTFDNLYRFLKDFMQFKEGEYKSFFRWRCQVNNFQQCDSGVAPDGETYIIQGLYMAAKKWGGNYQSEADAILKAMFDESNGHRSMFDSQQNLIKFVPGKTNKCNNGGQLDEFTDPSYVVPAFYEYWRTNTADSGLKNRLSSVISASRTLLTNAVSNKGLAPDYAAYDGKNSIQIDSSEGCRGTQYGYDAWRTAMNWSVDYQRNRFASAPALSINLQQTMSGYAGGTWDTSKIPSVLNIDNTNPSSVSARVGHVSMLAMSTLANPNPQLRAAFDKIDPNAPGALTQNGNNPYYDGLLYYVALAHLTGQFAW
jgi:oligosaccharide reducing-end xylanase